VASSLLPALLLDCGGHASVTCSDGPPGLEIGEGAQGFLPIDEGATVYVFCGPQGGRHVFLRMRATGLAADFGFTARLADAATDRELAYVSVPTAHFHQDGTACVSDLYRVFLEVPTVDADGAQANFQAQATDSLGRQVSAQRGVTVNGSMVTCSQ
jgi:hypothetical protein